MAPDEYVIKKILSEKLLIFKKFPRTHPDIYNSAFGHSPIIESAFKILEKFMRPKLSGLKKKTEKKNLLF